VQISFNLLGPLTAELRTGQGDAHPTELDTGPFKQRLLLAMLLCRCNNMVLVEELIDTLWWDAPPRTAHKNIQVYVSHLRKLLTADGQTGRLLYRPSGYQLVLTSAEVDALRFEDLARAGRLALRRDDPRASADFMRQALGLWRGPALADLQVSPALREETARLDDRRLSVYEDWFEAELLLGNHADVLEEIEAVVRAHPLRERLRSHQLTALYRGGRQAEALAEYDNLRQTLTAELGLDPSPVLQRLYQGILSGQPALNAPEPARRGDPPGPPGPGRTRSPVLASGQVAAHLSGFPGDDAMPEGQPPDRAQREMPAARPSGLPRAADDFTGRQDVLGELLAFFDHGASSASGPRRSAAVVGPPGAGASTLALQAAHALAPRYRDGPILLSLRDEKGAPRPPADLIDDLLGLLQPLPQRPRVAVPDQSTLLRSRLADLQMLLILDGVTDEAQVRPLLPGTGDCSVILTSCRALSGLDGISRFSLGVFTEDEALDLLSRLIGTQRVARARSAAIRIVHACGLLPLAVRTAGARLAGLDNLPLERFADRLEDKDRLLDELVHGDLSVRDCFDRYLRGLDSAERLALMVVAAAWGTTSSGPCEMEQLLERLVGVHALTITDRGFLSAAYPLPFAMPTPLWVYARQLLSAAAGDARS
jgi:DNA-binding SARP family transcriptional activator